MESFWAKTIKNKQKFPKVNSDMETSVCIIGAGLTGLSCGYYLGRKCNFVIIDKSTICSSTSGKNTGKITSQHGLFYKYLLDSNGKDFARKYMEANGVAIEKIEQIINKEHIECDFKRNTSYVFTRQQTEKDKIVEEEKSVNKLQRNKSKLMSSTPLPLETISAVKFENQAQINPLKYGYGLAEAITKNGGKIFENSIVTKIEKVGNKYEIYVNDEYKITADKVVLATRYPTIKVPGYYFLKMYQSTSYAIVCDVKQELFEGYYISSDNPVVSFRVIEEDGKKLLLAVGYDYKTGKKPLTNGYVDLETQVKTMYPQAEVLYKWSAEDCISLDKIAYIGEYSNLMKNLYVATGYNKWGLTISNIAANIITDKILGKTNEYEELFKSRRLEPVKNKSEVKNMLAEVKDSLILSNFKIPKQTTEDIKKGEGKIVRVNNKKIGVYKTEAGDLLTIKPKCTHLGCELYFNNDDKVWECPCHGSKFEPNGKAVEVPAVKSLNLGEETKK